MDVIQAASKRRTIRRFQNKEVPFEALEKCVEAARLAPSARNIQEVEFIAVNDKETTIKLNEVVLFGGTVRKNGRVKGEEAKAFIAIIAEKERSDEEYTKINVGIAAASIALAAFDQGLGTCIQGAIEREKIKEILGIPKTFSLPLVVSIGFPAEQPIAEDAKGNDFGYLVDEKGELHVPKRPMKDVLHKNKF